MEKSRQALKAEVACPRSLDFGSGLSGCLSCVTSRRCANGSPFVRAFPFPESLDNMADLVKILRCNNFHAVDLIQVPSPAVGR